MNFLLWTHGRQAAYQGRTVYNVNLIRRAGSL